MKKKATIILGIAFALSGLLAGGYIALRLGTMQGFSSPVLAVVSSPTVPADEVWLLQEGFVDRGITLFVKSPLLHAGKPQRVTSLDWDGLYSFKDLRWSADGRFVVFSLRLVGADSADVMAFAFDFATHEAIMPPWQGRDTTSRKPIEAWKTQEESVRARAEQHGGLSERVFAREHFRDHSQKIWIWQVPKG